MWVWLIDPALKDSGHTVLSNMSVALEIRPALCCLPCRRALNVSITLDPHGAGTIPKAKDKTMCLL